MKVPEQIAEDKQVSLMDELEKEIHLLKYLRHQNIVNYYDSCKGQNQEVKIFMEYMPQGSL
jgi:serine/threonine protein kinase